MPGALRKKRGPDKHVQKVCPVRGALRSCLAWLCSERLVRPVRGALRGLDDILIVVHLVRPVRGALRN